MSLNLEKGQNISLEKEAPNENNFTIGLGWTVNRSGGRDYDLDASIFMLDSNNKMPDRNAMIYFGHLKSACRSVIHSGDNLVGGSGNKDDEQISSLLE